MTEASTGRTSRFPVHDEVVRLALEELRRGVREQPPGSNTGERVRRYQAATWLGGSGWPWCVAFWQWLLKRAGFRMPYLGAGAYALYEWAREQGWTVPAAGAIPGDAVVFDVGAGHLGVLTRKVKGGTVRTVDGNVADEVGERERPLGLVRGFVHFPEKALPAPTPARPPMFEVVTSEAGQKLVYVSGARAIGRRLARILGRHPEGVVIRRKRAR